jgi:hypothetical protein
MTTIAGDGDCDYAGDGGDATGASLSSPRGVAVDALGAIFISETRLTATGSQFDCHVRRIDPGTGEITLAGSANCASPVMAACHSAKSVSPLTYPFSWDGEVALPA